MTVFRDPVDGAIPIDSVKEIETMIDLLAERFTISPVSEQEYDTEVKKKAIAILGDSDLDRGTVDKFGNRIVRVTEIGKLFEE